MAAHLSATTPRLAFFSMLAFGCAVSHRIDSPVPDADVREGDAATGIASCPALDVDDVGDAAWVELDDRDIALRAVVGGVVVLELAPSEHVEIRDARCVLREVLPSLSIRAQFTVAAGEILRVHGARGLRARIAALAPCTSLFDLVCTTPPLDPRCTDREGRLIMHGSLLAASDHVAIGDAPGAPDAYHRVPRGLFSLRDDEVPGLVALTLEGEPSLSLYGVRSCGLSSPSDFRHWAGPGEAVVFEDEPDLSGGGRYLLVSGLSHEPYTISASPVPLLAFGASCDAEAPASGVCARGAVCEEGVCRSPCETPVEIGAIRAGEGPVGLPVPGRSWLSSRGRARAVYHHRADAPEILEMSASEGCVLRWASTCDALDLEEPGLPAPASLRAGDDLWVQVAATDDMLVPVQGEGHACLLLVARADAP